MARRVLSDVPVKTGPAVVDKIDVPQWDSVAEAVAEIGEAEAIDLINTQYKTRLMNKARNAATAPPPSKALQAEALTRIFKDPAKTLLLQSVATDPTKLADFLAKEAELLKAEYEESRKARMAELAALQAKEEAEGASPA